MPDRIFSLLFDHPLPLLGGFIAVAAIAMLLAGRPRRWYVWLFDAVAAAGIVIAAVLIYFFTGAASALDTRLASLAFASSPNARWETLDEYRGNVVVVNYWATWCAPCVHEIPELNRAAREFGREVVFLAITDEDFVLIEHFLRKHPIEAKVARFVSEPPAGKLAAFAYGARPTTMVIDHEGNVKKRLVGARTYDEFAKAIREAL